MIKTHLTCGSCLALLLALVAIPVSADAFESNSVLTVSMESRTFANAENVYDTSSVSRTTESLGYVTDVHGTIYGPEDYAIDGDNIYLLDSGTNTVLVYTDNKLVDRYLLDGFVAEHIAVQDGELYAIGTNMQIYHVTPAGSRVILDVSPWNEMDSVSDFSIRDDRLYVTLPGRDGGKTYIFSIDALQGRTKKTEPTVVTEKTLSDGTTYTVTPILEDDYLLSGLWELQLTYPDGSVKTIPVHSAHMLAGVEPLTLGEDSFVALISEVDSDEDYHIVYEQSIWELTYEGEILRTQSLPEQYKGVDNAVKVIDDAVYYLRTTENKMELVQLNEAVLAEERVSRLVEITPIIEESEAGFSLQSTISGDDMIATAESYRRNFSWSCVAANLTAMSNWECPSYVTGAGTYTNMPYCWGGFDTTSSFTTGLASSINGVKGHVGNTNGVIVSNTYGLDCSGFVSRCWGFTSRGTTYSLAPENSNGLTKKVSISQVKRGDALNWSENHIMLIDSYDAQTGAMLIYECTTSSNFDKVVYLSYNWSNLSSTYTPIRYVQ